jgi:RimJ/RimL family protein N-acetyltransferase
MHIEIMPCTVEHLEKLIEGAEAFQLAYGLQVVDGYMPFAGALQHILKRLQESAVAPPWTPSLFVHRADNALVGFGGFKSVPDALRRVEIGYAVAPSYQGQGIAASTAIEFIELAFSSGLVDTVFAHTLAEHNASTKVLEKCGMTRVADAKQMVEPGVGEIWQWQIVKD